MIVRRRKPSLDDRRRQGAALVFLAAILAVVGLLRRARPRRRSRLAAGRGRRGRPAAGLDRRRLRRLLRRSDRRHGDPRDARAHVAPAHADRLLGRPLRRDHGPRPDARTLPLGRCRHLPLRARRPRAPLRARRACARPPRPARDPLPGNRPQPPVDLPVFAVARRLLPPPASGRVREGAPALG